MISRLIKFDAELLIDRYNHRVVDAFGDNVVKFIEDFTGTPLAADNIQGWTTTLVEAGAGESTVTQADISGGALLLTADANDNDGVNITKLGENWRVDNNSFYFGTRIRLSENTQSDFFIGLSVDDTNILTNLGKRIGFRKVDGETGIAFEFKKTNTTSVSNIITVANDTWIELEFVYDKSAGTLTYYVNGVEYGPIAVDNLPDTELKHGIHFLSGADGAGKTMHIDYIRTFQFGRS